MMTMQLPRIGVRRAAGGRQPGPAGDVAVSSETGPATVLPGGCAQVLNWQEVLNVLEPVARKWDLAILCNLYERGKGKPGQMLAEINRQAQPRQLHAQYLSDRLRVLEADGYIRCVQTSRVPLVRVFYLLGPGRLLIEELAGLVRRVGRDESVKLSVPGPAD